MMSIARTHQAQILFRIINGLFLIFLSYFLFMEVPFVHPGGGKVGAITYPLLILIPIFYLTVLLFAPRITKKPLAVFFFASSLIIMSSSFVFRCSYGPFLFLVTNGIRSGFAVDSWVMWGIPNDYIGFGVNVVNVLIGCYFFIQPQTKPKGLSSVTVAKFNSDGKFEKTTLDI